MLEIFGVLTEMDFPERLAALRKERGLTQQSLADAVGVQPQEIWPARYNPDGTPKRGLHSKKGSSSARARNDHVEARK